jgi:CheY-like chemotaxis protein
VDAALLDVQMPELDGFEVARRFRAAERERGARRVPLIAVTAHAMKGDRERLLAAGLDDYLAKPFEAAELRRTLARVCGAGGPQVGAERAAAGNEGVDAPAAVSAAGPRPGSGGR